jgi:hypothetical protein
MWRQNFEFVTRMRSFVRGGVSQTILHPLDDKASVTVIYIGIPLLFEICIHSHHQIKLLLHLYSSDCSVKLN